MTQAPCAGGRRFAAAALVLSLWSPAPISAQEPPPKTSKTETAAPTPAEVDQAIVQLGAAGYAERVAAEKLLRRAGESARGALKKATESSDPEVRHRARRLLGELDQPRQGKARDDKAGGGLRRREPRGQGAPRRGREQTLERDPRSEMQRRIDELFRELRQSGPVLGAPPIDLQQLFQELEVGGLRSNSGTSVQVGPDGVRVEVTETHENGEPQKKVYEADSVEGFREQHPEVAERFFGSGTGGIRIGTPSPLRPRGLTPRNGPQERSPIDLPPTSGPKLGVMVAPIEPQLADYLGLEPGRGLYVSEVLPGSLAETLGVETKDVLVRLGGVELRQISDVAAALQGAKPGEKLIASLIRRGKQLTVQAEAPVLAPTKEQVLRRRPTDPKSGGGERR